MLYRAVQCELETFLAHARACERPAPRFVEQELRAFLRCGLLAHGFLRLHCGECGHDRLVAFSCKRRSFCPSCGGRRMADTAAHLVDRVLPEAPVRQWVLTLPYALRYRCAYDARLTSEVLRAFIRALFAELRRRARRKWGVRAEQCGAVSFIQRFGSALDLNVHFHTLALDGAYSYAVGQGQPTRFLPLPPPEADEVARVLAGAARRIERLLEARAGEDADALARDQPLLALLAAASLRTRVATGPQRGEPWRRLGDRVEPPGGGANEVDPEASARAPRHGGMSLHADVSVPVRDRRRLERLCRYVARPPLANERLEERPDGRLALRLKTRWRDGTTHILMERRELIDRLVPLIPPPRAHQVRYHGILAPSASQRDRVVPGGQLDGELSRRGGERCSRAGCDVDQRAVSFQQGGEQAHGARPEAPARPAAGAPGPEEGRRQIGPVGSARRMRWATLLQRVFEIDALRCPLWVDDATDRGHRRPGRRRALPRRGRSARERGGRAGRVLLHLPRPRRDGGLHLDDPRGMFEKYPRLKCAVLEAGSNWITAWLDRMDHKTEVMHAFTPMKLLPSEYFKRQCVISAEPDESITAAVAQHLGAEYVIWASDYPHLDATFNVVGELREKIASLPEAAQRKILGENALRFYGLSR